jgi:hypothetical protein
MRHEPFCPVMKHLRTEVQDGLKRRVEDAPASATPFRSLKPASRHRRKVIAAPEQLYRIIVVCAS